MPLKYGLIEPMDLGLPRLPRSLDGLRIAHLSDLHIRRPRRRYQQLAEQLTRMRVDLVFLTGDYMTKTGDEHTAAKVLGELCAKLRPTLGIFGVFGNHDTALLRDLCRDLPVQWLDNAMLPVQDKLLEIFGVQMLKGEAPDPVAMTLAWRRAHQAPIRSGARRPLRLLLSHIPDTIVTAAGLEMDVVFSGHTHGGQCRLPGARPLVNSSDLPLKLTSGVLRCGPTLAVVSRGIGEVGLPLRICCPPHVPVYTLRRQGLAGENSGRLHRLYRW